MAQSDNPARRTVPLQGLCYYNLDNTDYDSINKFLSSLVEQALITLQQSYCLQIGEDNLEVQPATLGRISSYYYLNHLTLRMFHEQLHPECTVPEVLDILSSAHEYADLPVRHNEDQINSELAQQLPLKVNPHSYDSSNTKTHLLLQAHLCQISLPSTDYQTDTKSVLDQAVRICQAMLDVSADQGWLVTGLQVIHLIQMVLQGRWLHDSSLLTLPHVLTYHVHCLRSASKSHAPGKERVSVQSLPELMAVCDGRFDVLQAMLEENLSRTQIDQIYQVLGRLPQIEMSLSVQGWWAERGSLETKCVSQDYRGGVRPDSDWILVHADQEYVLKVDLQRINKHKQKDNKAYTPRFPKPKDEGWFLVLGEIETKEVIALKRIGYVRNKTSVSLAFYSPEVEGRVIYTVYLMSDCYLGLDQQYDVCLEVTPANIAAQVNTDMEHTDLAVTF